MTYEINIISESSKTAYVIKPGFGFCERFDGETFKADAIRYVRRVGGQTAKFKFTKFENPVSG